MTYIHLPFLLFISSTCTFSLQPFLLNTSTKRHAFYRRETWLQNAPFFADGVDDSEDDIDKNEDSNNSQDEKSSALMNEESSLSSETITPLREISTTETDFPLSEVIAEVSKNSSEVITEVFLNSSQAIAEVFLNNSEAIAEIFLNNTKSLLRPLGFSTPGLKDTDSKVVIGALAVSAGTILLVSNNVVLGMIGGATGGYVAKKPGALGGFMRGAGALAVQCIDLAFKASREEARVKREEARVERQAAMSKKGKGRNDEIWVEKMLKEGKLGFEDARMKEFQKDVDEVLEEAEEELKKVENELLELNGMGEVENKDELLDEVQNVEGMLEEREEDMQNVKDELIGEAYRMDKEKEEIEVMGKSGEESSVKNEVLSAGELDVDSSDENKFEAELDEVLEENEEEMDQVQPETRDELLDEVQNVERMLEEREEDMLKTRDELLGEVYRMDKEKEEIEVMGNTDEELGENIDAQDEALFSEANVPGTEDTQTKDELLEEFYSMAKKKEETQRNDEESEVGQEDRFISQEEWDASIKLAQQYNPDLFQNIDQFPEPQVEEWQAASQFAKNLSDEINKKVETFAESEDTEENRQKDWEDMTVVQLKAELRKRKLKVSGRKKELIQRLKDSEL